MEDLAATTEGMEAPAEDMGEAVADDRALDAPEPMDEGNAPLPGDEPEEGVEPDLEAEAEGESKAEPETYEVKVNGKMEKFTIDELKQHASAGAVATQRFQEAAEMRREAEGVKQQAQDTLARVEQTMKQNPLQVFKAVGTEALENMFISALESTDPNIQAAITKAVEVSQQGPDARQQRQLQQENERLRREQEQYRSAQQERQAAQQQATIKQQFTELSSSALEAAGLPASEATVRELALTYNQVFKNGEPISPETVARAAQVLANEKVPSLADVYLANLTPEQLAEKLGAERMSALTQSKIEQVKKAQSAPPKSTRPTRQRAERRVTTDDLREQFAAMYEQ